MKVKIIELIEKCNNETNLELILYFIEKFLKKNK